MFGGLPYPKGDTMTLLDRLDRLVLLGVSFTASLGRTSRSRTVVNFAVSLLRGRGRFEHNAAGSVQKCLHNDTVSSGRIGRDD